MSRLVSGGTDIAVVGPQGYFVGARSVTMVEGEVVWWFWWWRGAAMDPSRAGDP
jgi:hypothetical protein